MDERLKCFLACVVLFLSIAGRGQPVLADVPEPPALSAEEFSPLKDLSFTAAGFSRPPALSPYISIYPALNDQYLPSVAYNWHHDEYLVVWHNLWADGTRDISARRISGQGELLDSFTVSSGAKDRAQPSVAYDPHNDRYLVVWSYDCAGDGSDWDVYGRFIPWDGPDANLTEFHICVWSSDQLLPQVVYNENPSWPEFLVVWSNGASVVGTNYIAGQRVYADGSGFPGAAFTIASHATDDYINPDVAYNLARNEYLVVYEKNCYDILAARLEANGNDLGSQISVATWPDAESAPAVAACTTENQYFVAWQSQVGSPEYDVYGRFINGDGTVADVLHMGDTSVYERSPDVSCNAGARHYLVVWEQQFNNLSGPYGVMGRLLHADKTQDAKFTIINPGTLPDDHWEPAVAAGSPGYLVAWERDLSGYRNTYGRLVWPDAVYLPLVLRGS